MSCAKWLSQFPNDILVETGSGGGSGIEYGLQYGFKEIHSMEINKRSYDICVGKFRGNKAVHLYLGDSVEVLPRILNKIYGKATFLLDAHVMDVNAVHGKKICPIIEELKIIIGHSMNIGVRHSVLIDDAKYFNGVFVPFEQISISDIRKTILDIDASYTIKVGSKSISAT